MEKTYCSKVGCIGVPGCPCMEHDHWERWKFDNLHNEQKLFDLASDLLQELQICRKFIGSREKMQSDGLAKLDELIANSATMINRKYTAQRPSITGLRSGA